MSDIYDDKAARGGVVADCESIFRLRLKVLLHPASIPP